MKALSKKGFQRDKCHNLMNLTNQNLRIACACLLCDQLLLQLSSRFHSGNRSCMHGAVGDDGFAVGLIRLLARGSVYLRLGKRRSASLANSS